MRLSTHHSYYTLKTLLLSIQDRSLYHLRDYLTSNDLESGLLSCIHIVRYEAIFTDLLL